MADSSPGWWSRLSLRARLTIVSTVVLAVGLVAGAALILTALDRGLTGSLDDVARQRGQDVARLIELGNLPDPVPVSGGTAGIQVVDAEQRVRAASPGGDHLVPILEPADIERARAGEAVHLDGARLGIDDNLRVVGVPAGTPDDPLTVLVASSLFEADRTVRFVSLALLIATPLLLAALATLSWLVIGAALRPVEELSRGAEAVTADRTDARLPVPAADDEIHRLAVTLNGMLARLQAANERQREFVADAAHELRSPLTSVRTQLEVALRHGDAGDWRETAEGLLEETDRMSRLVDDLLVLARLDESTLARPRAYPVDLNELVRDVVARRSETGAHPAVVQSGGPGVLVRADPEALARAVTNLLDNAQRFARSRVIVAVHPADGADRMRCVVEVVDDGPGIAEADRDRVFERFSRVDGSRVRDASVGGAGLGLAIVRATVEAHGGQVRLSDAEPGLRVELVLPVESPATTGDRY